MSERIGVFGGAFDPPHVGHVLAVQYVLLTAPVERVFVIPCAQHPFGKHVSPFEHRCAMCRLAFAPLAERAKVLDLEGKRRGASYTIDTIRELSRRFPEAEFELIVGSDIVEELPQWREVEELKRLATLRVLPRLPERASGRRGAEDKDGPYYLPAVSGTTLRRMLAEGRDLSAHVPREVLAYIERERLYR
jgi:nicotinate-nucleotide adenylyltransferase